MDKAFDNDLTEPRCRPARGDAGLLGFLFRGTVMGWGCPSPNRNNSRRLREDDRSAVGDSPFRHMQGSRFF